MEIGVRNECYMMPNGIYMYVHHWHMWCHSITVTPIC